MSEKVAIVFRHLKKVDGQQVSTAVKVFKDPEEARKWSMADLRDMKRLLSAYIMDPAVDVDAPGAVLPTVGGALQRMGIKEMSDMVAELPVTDIALVSIVRN